jgi:hypothetical protein
LRSTIEVALGVIARALDLTVLAICPAYARPAVAIVIRALVVVLARVCGDGCAVETAIRSFKRSALGNIQSAIYSSNLSACVLIPIRTNIFTSRPIIYAITAYVYAFGLADAVLVELGHA